MVFIIKLVVALFFYFISGTLKVLVKLHCYGEAKWQYICVLVCVSPTAIKGLFLREKVGFESELRQTVGTLKWNAALLRWTANNRNRMRRPPKNSKHHSNRQAWPYNISSLHNYQKYERISKQWKCYSCWELWRYLWKLLTCNNVQCDVTMETMTQSC